MATEASGIPSQRAAATRRAFVVVGMHRSGTSAMTRTLSLLGAGLPEQLMPAAANNPSGFWEPQAVADLNDEILQAQDSEWDDVFAFRQRQYLSNFDRVYLGRAVELLDQQFNGHEVIVLKDPRISVLTAFWHRALLEAGYAVHYVVMVRNPLEVAESLRARDGFPREKSFLLWTSYMIAIDRDTRNRARTFVSYDQLMNDWRSVRRRIEAETGVPFPRDSAAAAIEIDRHLNSGLRHHTASSDDLFARPEVSEHVKTIYRIFASACEGKAIDSAALDAIEAELSKMDQVIGPLLADLKLSARVLASEAAELRDACAGAEAERSRLCSELEGKQLQLDELMDRIGAAETRAAQLAAELQMERELRSSDKLRLDELKMQFEAQLEDQQQLNASILAQLRERELELVEKGTESETLVARLTMAEADHASIVAQLRERELELAEKGAESETLVAQLTIAEAELESAREKLKNGERRIDELVCSLSLAQSKGSELEQSLTAHFHETATLSRIISETQQLTIDECEKTRRIRELYDAIVSEPRWWSILARSHRSRLQKARLRRLGLFDGQTYLRKNPDVAAAGEDPVHHYLHHGIDEQRPL